MASISQQLNDLIDPSPALIDPEDDINVETSAKLVASEDIHQNESIEEMRPSLLRRQKAQKLLDTDEKYICFHMIYVLIVFKL